MSDFTPDHDVAIIGGGPAAGALAAACAAVSLLVVRIGPAAPWTATYGTWVDDLAEHASSLATTFPVDVVTTRRRTLERTYGVFDNERLRSSLAGGSLVDSRVASVRHHQWGALVLTESGDSIAARIVIDAAGAQTPFVLGPRVRHTPLQRAYGLVLDHRPDVIGGDGGVFMNWHQCGDQRPPTFLYVVALPAQRWLIEETSLASWPPMPFEQLRDRLAARLGADLTSRAEHVECVSIPMRPGVANLAQSTVGFGAAAGYVHPATGYSVAASLRAAPHVAAAIRTAVAIDEPRLRSRTVWDAVWPRPQRRARALHDYGLASLLRLSHEDIAVFFEAFFSLPTDRWSAYLRVDATAAEVGQVMTGVFRNVPWRVRRQLAAGDPRLLIRLLR